MIDREILVYERISKKLAYSNHSDVRDHKRDKENHGFGVKSIQAIARKYGGSTIFQASDGWFVLKVLLPLPKETERLSVQ